MTQRKWHFNAEWKVVHSLTGCMQPDPLRDFSGVYTVEKSPRIFPNQNLFHVVIGGYYTSTYRLLVFLSNINTTLFPQATRDNEFKLAVRTTYC